MRQSGGTAVAVAVFFVQYTVSQKLTLHVDHVSMVSANEKLERSVIAGLWM